jgi:uncharacterized protein
MEAHISWNYTTWLNIAFLALAAVLLVRFFTTGGRDMLRMMGGSPDDTAGHDHHERADHDGHRQGGHHEPQPAGSADPGGHEQGHGAHHAALPAVRRDAHDARPASDG